jgi:hypothetical protein
MTDIQEQFSDTTHTDATDANEVNMVRTLVHESV